MAATYNPNHVAEGLALLTDQFKGRPNIEGLLKSWLGPIQEIEDVLWEVLNGRDLATAIGAQLDTLGYLVGENRAGRDDEEYRVAIRLRVLINKSQGRAEDVLTMLAALGIVFEYSEPGPARFRVYSFSNLATDRPLIEATRQVKPAGVAFEFQGNSSSGGLGSIDHAIQYDHTSAYIVAHDNGGFAHTSGTSDNHPVYVVTY